MEIPKPVVTSEIKPRDSSVDRDTIVFPANADRLDQFPALRFFSPALLYLHGQFTDEPLIHFQYVVNRQVRYLMHRFSQPLFGGLSDAAGDPGWNHTLWAVGVELWPAFEQFMLSVVISDSAAGRLFRTGVQDVKIVDPLWLDRGGIRSPDAPLADVAVFGVDGNNAAMAILRPRETWQRLPWRVAYPPRDRTRKMASAVFGGQVDLSAAADLMIKPPADTLPVELRTQDVSDLPPERQAEYLAAVEVYRKSQP